MKNDKAPERIWLYVHKTMNRPFSDWHEDFYSGRYAEDVSNVEYIRADLVAQVLRWPKDEEKPNE